MTPARDHCDPPGQTGDPGVIPRPGQQGGHGMVCTRTTTRTVGGRGPGCVRVRRSPVRGAVRGVSGSSGRASGWCPPSSPRSVSRSTIKATRSIDHPGSPSTTPRPPGYCPTCPVLRGGCRVDTGRLLSTRGDRLSTPQDGVIQAPSAWCPSASPLGSPGPCGIQPRSVQWAAGS